MKRIVLAVALLLMLTSSGFAWPQRGCTVKKNNQASINLRQANDTERYFYVFVTNANHNGKWAVQAEVQGYSEHDGTFLYTDPANELKKSVTVAPNVRLRLGSLSRFDQRVAVDYSSGICRVYSLDALYPQ